MIKYILLFLVAFLGYMAWTSIPVERGIGIQVKEEPKISSLNTKIASFDYKEATITPKKRIEGEVRILNKKRYFVDSKKDYVPVDFLVGWNELSDTKNVEFIRFPMNGRNYDFKFASPPLPRLKIELETELWHLIPSTNEMRQQLLELRNGHIIKVKGLLVNLEEVGTINWISSETSGRKNAKLIWVEEISYR